MISAKHGMIVVMSRYYYDKKREVESCNKIQTSLLKNNGILEPENLYQNGTITWTSGWSENKSNIAIFCSTITSKLSEPPYLRLVYTVNETYTDKKREYDYKITIVRTPCNYGGFRWWFICPLNRDGVYCGRRVGVVYLSGNYFGCRHCHELTYRSKNQFKVARNTIFKAFKNLTKIEDLEDSIKRQHYNGVPTKKMQKLLTLKEQGIF